MAITNLTNTTWTFKDTGVNYPSGYSSTHNYDINYTISNLSESSYMNIYTPVGGPDFQATVAMPESTHSNELFYVKTTDSLYISQGLTDGEGWYLATSSTNINKLATPPTITITGGTDVTNSELVTWLEDNAVQQIVSYTITPSLTNVTSSNTGYEIEEGGTWTTTLTADTGYLLPESITVIGATSSYSSSTGVLTLSNPTGDVTLTVTAKKDINAKELVTYEAFEVFKRKLNELALGVVGGVYDDSVLYSVGNLAYFNNRIYVCKVQCRGIAPVYENYWDILISYEPVIEAALCTSDAILYTADSYGLVTTGHGTAPSQLFELSNGQSIQLSDNTTFMTVEY